VRLAPLGDMDLLREVGFTEALGFLHELLGAEVKVTLNFYGRFFGGGIRGELRRVETLPPDYEAIDIAIEGGQGLFLDPADTRAFLCRGEAGGEWLELRTAFGASVEIERAAGGR
jgi:hypothetical protein